MGKEDVHQIAKVVALRIGVHKYGCKNSKGHTSCCYQISFSGSIGFAKHLESNHKGDRCYQVYEGK
jgi:hypothetical protein